MSILKSVETAGKIKPQDLQTYCLIHGGSGNGKTTAAFDIIDRIKRPSFNKKQQPTRHNCQGQFN